MAKARWGWRPRGSGSPVWVPFLLRPAAHFSGVERLGEAGERGYVLIRDGSCRLFGFHGVDDGAGGFSFDHMFGF